MAETQTAKTETHAKTELQKDLFILKQLVSKDFKIKYRRSVLGVAWSVLNPLLMMIVMAIVFTTIFAQGRNGSVSPEMYPLYLIVGNVTFAVMSDSTSQALASIIQASSLLKKVKVHRSPPGISFCCPWPCSCSCFSAWASACCFPPQRCSSATSCIFGASC